MDAEMFASQARRIEKLLYRIARSYLNDDQEAEDAVQDALIRAWEKRNTLRDLNQFKPWMTRILSNRCKDILRKRRRWSFYPLEEDTVQVELPETENAVMESMKKLRPELRIVMTLHYVDGYSIQEMADALGIPTGTVKTRMRSARKQLSRTLLIDWEEIV
ncbi:MAG: RNA polymerase sigma factor [Clostridia bacterium]|nr:RNA polymerase sigma factor [Clostridia bacterium]